uniref:Uncharacterized protein n=1 Tax=Arundo donax TaxID=35708 RepID=A0A0A9GV04_ARUDO
MPPFSNLQKCMVIQPTETHTNLQTSVTAVASRSSHSLPKTTRVLSGTVFTCEF